MRPRGTVSDGSGAWVRERSASLRAWSALARKRSPRIDLRVALSPAPNPGDDSPMPTLANPLHRLRSAMDINAPGRNVVREAWDRLASLPGGKRVFSYVIGRAARYTGSIGAEVVTVRRGYAEVRMKDTPLVRNHLRSVHAVALVNLAELTGNLALSYSLPEDARFIVAGLSIEYVKKARGAITAESRPPEISSAERREYPVVVTLRNAAAEVVATATLRTLVGPKAA